MPETTQIYIIFGAVTPVLVGIIGFFVSKSYNRVDGHISDTNDELANINSRLSVLESRQNLTAKEVKDLSDMLYMQSAETAGQQARVAEINERIKNLLDEHRRHHK